MAKLNRKYIDKHWLVFLIRGGLAAVLGCLILFGGIQSIENTSILICVFLMIMGVVDAVSALYNSSRKHGWINSVIDAVIDVVAAVFLLFFAKNNLTNIVLVLSIYTIASGLIDIFHGFLSTVDPTDRFIRILAGVCGCVMGIVILNAGKFEITPFLRFFGAYVIVVGVTSLIYGVHNRSQNIEDRIARKESAKARSKAKKPSKKKK